ncbi:MAG: oligopeptide transporter, OPT family, partial [Gammaproteobacteria bacterium]|nr:oligopeptide transporter, OPT family [Gammaproteobacteria bacterium]
VACYGMNCGIYLPLDLMVPIFLGGLLAHLAERHLRRTGVPQEQLEHRNRKGILFAAGMITGEALMGIGIAVPIVTSGSADVLALPAALHFGGFAGLLVLGVLAWWLYRTAVAADKV